MTGNIRTHGLYRCWACGKPFTIKGIKSGLLCCPKPNCQNKIFRMRRKGTVMYPRLLCSWCEQPLEGEVREGRYHPGCAKTRGRVISEREPLRSLTPERSARLLAINRRNSHMYRTFREVFR